MELKPFAEILAMSKEKIDAAMAPLRAHMVKSQAQLEMAKLDGEILETQSKCQEMCIEKTINFPLLLDLLDEITILERRREQYKKVLRLLFPEKIKK